MSGRRAALAVALAAALAGTGCSGSGHAVKAAAAPTPVERLTCRGIERSRAEQRRLTDAVYAELERPDALDPTTSEADTRAMIRAHALTFCANAPRADRTSVRPYRPTVRGMARTLRLLRG